MFQCYHAEMASRYILMFHLVVRIVATLLNVAICDVAVDTTYVTCCSEMLIQHMSHVAVGSFGGCFYRPTLAPDRTSGC